ncbi:hypothetical protein HAX54_022171 [Datura stramonium]|uniref:Uncharacterized protein n=1 Tax=Datura stramonium TaxID=4076 RepID=A0ABS8UW79_DATST|nr:hypothetical protein [Datura stramonium]
MRIFQKAYSEWQQISSPSSPTTGNNNDTQFSREVGIQIAATEITTLPFMTEGTSDNNDDKGEGNKWLKKNLRELSCWVVQIASKIRNYAASKVGIGTNFTSNRSKLLAVLLVSLFYWMIQKKWRRQRQIYTTSKKLMLLVREKDQKIEQLSLQISQMNESLLTGRKVPVLQVG